LSLYESKGTFHRGSWMALAIITNIDFEKRITKTGKKKVAHLLPLFSSNFSPQNMVYAFAFREVEIILIY